MDRRSTICTIFIHAAALLVALAVLAPLAWLFVMSVSSNADLSARPLHWWPQDFDLSRYRQLLSLETGAAFLASLRNSIETFSPRLINSSRYSNFRDLP